MSKVVDFPRAPGSFAFHPAVRRLQGLTNVLSDLHEVDLQSQQDMRRALWILDLTNRCVQIILSDFKDDSSILELTRHSKDLIDGIARAREMVDQLGSASH